MPLYFWCILFYLFIFLARGVESYILFFFARVQCLDYFIVELFCYICSFLFFMWLFAFTYALLAGLRFTCRGYVF
jgi:hypothetical protein